MLRLAGSEQIAGKLQIGFPEAAIIRCGLLFQLFDLKQFNIQYSDIFCHVLSPPGTVESQLVSCQLVT